jgi:hypothetical protein
MKELKKLLFAVVVQNNVEEAIMTVTAIAINLLDFISFGSDNKRF